MLSAATVAESQGSAADVMTARLAVVFICCVVFVCMWNAVK